MVKVTINKLMENKFIGYRAITNDQVIFETDNDKGILRVDNIDTEILIDLTPHTIQLLSELLRYLKTDLEGDK